MNDKLQSKHIWASKSVEERQKYMANEMHVNHPQFIKSVNEIKRRMQRCINEETGAAVLFLVPSGAGKTHVRRFFKNRWPDIHTDYMTTVPVVSFDIPTNPNARSMGRAILLSMGDAAMDRANASAVLDRIIHLLPQIETKIIFIDNLQDVPEKRGSKGILEIGGWIRRLVDEGKRLVVLLGTPAAIEIVAANSQLRRRTAKQLQMDYFHFDKPSEKKRFLRFLQEVDQVLPLAESSALATDGWAEAIYYATNGIQDYIFQLLIEAVGVAVSSKREALELTDFERAFQIVFQDASGSINPFTPNTPRRPLDQVGEPFHRWFDKSNPSLRPPI